MDTPEIALLTTAFVLAGLTKGIVGFGLPTVAVGLGSLVIAPAQAAALLVIPSLVTNVWQGWDGPDRVGLINRFGVFLAALLVSTIAISALGFTLPAEAVGSLPFALIGGVLIVYGSLGLVAFQPRVPHRLEPASQPLLGAITGAVTATTGLFAFPSAMYLQALGLNRAHLVQALGITFTTGTIGLAIGLTLNGHVTVGVLGASAAAVLPVLGGMMAGRWLASRISQSLFRTLFFGALIVLGLRLSFEGFGH